MIVRPSNLFADLDVRVESGVPLGPLTWFGVGGAADALVSPQSIEDLATLVRRCRQGDVPLRVLGSGANLLVADEGVSGIVVRLDAPALREVAFNAHDAVERVRAAAGADMAKLLMETTRRGLAGLQQMAGIPASVGGAIRMNAGGAFGAIGDAVANVGCLDPSGEIVVHPRATLSFDYRRTSITDPVILWAEFDLHDDDPVRLRERVKEIFAYKKSTQPLADHSAGCVFRNPVDPATGDRTSAGGLIDASGLKGTRIGGATVSDQHANFMVIEPGGTATDLLRLIDLVRERVLAARGIELVPEIAIWR